MFSPYQTYCCCVSVFDTKACRLSDLARFTNFSASQKMLRRGTISEAVRVMIKLWLCASTLGPELWLKSRVQVAPHTLIQGQIRGDLVTSLGAFVSRSEDFWPLQMSS